MDPCIASFGPGQTEHRLVPVSFSKFFSLVVFENLRGDGFNNLVVHLIELILNFGEGLLLITVVLELDVTRLQLLEQKFLVWLTMILDVLSNILNALGHLPIVYEVFGSRVLNPCPNIFCQSLACHGILVDHNFVVNNCVVYNCVVDGVVYNLVVGVVNNTVVSVAFEFAEEGLIFSSVRLMARPTSMSCSACRLRLRCAHAFRWLESPPSDEQYLSQWVQRGMVAIHLIIYSILYQV